MICTILLSTTLLISTQPTLIIILKISFYLSESLSKSQSLHKKMFAYPSTLQLMKQSKAFKVTAALSILCFVAGLVLMIVYPFADCGYQTTLPNNCQDLSSQCPYTCPDYQLTFCCRWNSTLGDYTTCFLKPETPRVEKHFRSCKAVRIVGSTLLGICFCLKVITIFIFFRLKKQNKRNSQILQRIYYIPPTPIYNNISFDRVQQPNLLHNAGKMHPQKQLEHKLDDRILEVNPSVNQQDDKFVQVEK